MTITVAGTYTSPDESPLSGWVALSLANPRAVHSTAPEFVASKRVVSELDETGSVSFEVTASDDPGWELGPVLYRVEEHLSQQEHLTWFGYLTEPVEGGGVRLEEVARIADPELGYWPPAYIPVPGPPNVLTVDSTTTGDPGTDADVTISGTSPEQALAFTIPRGEQGDVGPPPHIGNDEPTDPEIVEWFDTNEDSVRGVLNSGDTMAGPLILSGDATDLLGAVPLQQLDAVGDSLIRITRPNVDDRLVEMWNGSAWSVVDYDSGWRDVSAGNADPDFSITYANIRRLGDQILFDCRGTRATAGGSMNNATDSIFIHLPTGWDYSGDNQSRGQATIAGVIPATVSNLYVSGPYHLCIRTSSGTWASGQLIGCGLSWQARTLTIPTSLPGTLVTPAPQ